MTDLKTGRPVVYGERHVEVLLDSVARLMALEPVETFADPGVRRSLHQLSSLADRRIDEALGIAPMDAAAQRRPRDRKAS